MRAARRSSLTNAWRDTLHDEVSPGSGSLPGAGRGGTEGPGWRLHRPGPDHIQAAVIIALALAEQPPLQPAVLRDPDGPDNTRPAIDVYYVPALRGSWAACKEGLEHPYTHLERPIVFDHASAQGRDDVVLAHLNHRLVAMSLRLLRAEIWSPDSNRFASMNVGEDARFVGKCHPGRVTKLPDATFYVGMIHRHNVSPKRTGGSYWHPCAVEEIQQLLGADWAFYQSRRGEIASAEYKS